MLERGGFSFIALLVINPIVILLYQNCSLSPVTHSEVASRQLITQKRTMSSVGTPEKVEINKVKVALPTIKDCNPSLENCPVTGAE